MGLFDSIAGALEGQTEAPGQGGMLGSVMGLLNSPEVGGLSGLMQKFSQGGMGEQVASWIGNGQNLPISGEQLQSALGSPLVQEIAAKMGLDPSTAASSLATLLPGVVDSMTPNGQLPESGSEISQLLSGLSGLFGAKSA